MQVLESESGTALDEIVLNSNMASESTPGLRLRQNSRDSKWDTLVGINPAAWAASLKQTPQLLQERAFQVRTLADCLKEKELESGGNMKRQLGWFDLISIGIGVILGSGIFASTPYVASQLAGPAVVLSYAVSSVSAVASALCYAEYAVDFPIAGGGYNFVSLTYGELIGWIQVANLLFGYSVSAAAVARSATQYWAQLLNSDLPGARVHVGGWTIDFVAAGTVIILSLLVVYGAREGSLFNIVVTAVHVAILLFIIAAGLVKAQPANLKPFAPYGGRGIFTGAAFVYFTFTGFDAVATSAEECRNPKRDLPIGIVGSLMVTTVLYIATAGVLVLLLPYTQIRSDDGAFATAFVKAGLGWAKYLVAVGALLGMISSCYVALYGQARILCVVARDHMLPPVLARIAPSTGTPVAAATVMGAITAGIALVTGFEELFVMTSCLALMTYWLTAHGCILRRFYIRGRSSPVPVLAFMAVHSAAAIGFSFVYQNDGSGSALLLLVTLAVIATAILHITMPILYVPKDFAVAGGPWLPSATAFFNVFLMASLKGAGTSGYFNIAWFMTAAVALYCLYSLHTAAHRDHPGAAGRPGAAEGAEDVRPLVAHGAVASERRDSSTGAAGGLDGAWRRWGSGAQGRAASADSDARGEGGSKAVSDGMPPLLNREGPLSTF